MKISVDLNNFFELMKRETKIKGDTKYPNHPNKMS